MSVRNFLIFRIAVNAAWGAAFIAIPELFINKKLFGEIEHLAAGSSSSKVISLLSDSFVSLGVLRASAAVCDLAYLLRGRVSRVHIIYSCSIELIQSIVGIYLWGTGNWNRLFISTHCGFSAIQVAWGLKHALNPDKSSFKDL